MEQKRTGSTITTTTASNSNKPRSRKRKTADVPELEKVPKLAPTIFKNFKSACTFYSFPGSHQIGSYGPKHQGIVRSYSNSTPGKDKLVGGVFLYRLKDEAYREKFKLNMKNKQKVRVFRKVVEGVEDLGLFDVEGFVGAKPVDLPDKFGSEFVKFRQVVS